MIQYSHLMGGRALKLGPLDPPAGTLVPSGRVIIRSGRSSSSTTSTCSGLIVAPHTTHTRQTLPKIRLEVLQPYSEIK